MKKTILAAVLAALGVVAGACNNVGDCPSASSITPGASCSGDNLSCPYTLQTPSMACDGTMVDGGVATSCVCTMGSWACPSPVSCGGDGGDDAATDGGGPEGDATVEAGEDAPVADAAHEAASEAATEAAVEAAAEAATEAAAEAASEASTDATGN